MADFHLTAKQSEALWVARNELSDLQNTCSAYELTQEALCARLDKIDDMLLAILEGKDE